MRTDLVRRVERLETAPGSDEADVERAAEIIRACQSARSYPSRATAEEKALSAATTDAEWSAAFMVGVRAAGGLAALVKYSFALPLPEPPERLGEIMTVEKFRALEAGWATDGGRC